MQPAFVPVYSAKTGSTSTRRERRRSQLNESVGRVKLPRGTAAMRVVEEGMEGRNSAPSKKIRAKCGTRKGAVTIRGSRGSETGQTRP